MPPKCPECGRFLSNDFVRGLLVEPAPCARCGSELSAEMFRAQHPEVLVDAPEPLAQSVRPPDLAPAAVRGEERTDPLEGWDREPLAGDEEEFVVALRPAAAAAVAGVTLVGAMVGARLWRRHRRVGGLLGGALAGGAALATVLGLDRQR